MPNGTCPHHEHVDRSIERIDATCERERAGLWVEINAMKKWALVGLGTLVLNLMGVVTTLVVVIAKG